MSTHDIRRYVKPGNLSFWQAIREWRCSRKNGHGAAHNGQWGYVWYQPTEILPGLWMQECQACGRFTVWREPVRPTDSQESS